VDKSYAPDSIEVCRTLSSLRSCVSEWRRNGERIALVPSGGRLHDGHIKLCELARQHADRIVYSMFVNRRQFSSKERSDVQNANAADHTAALDAAGIDLIYAPPEEEFHQAGDATRISVGDVSAPFEGESRPHYFPGLVLAMTKMINRVGPDIVVLGERDFQKTVVMRRLVADLDMPVEIITLPTVRDADGLPLSWRNAELSKTNRAVASEFFPILTSIVDELSRGTPVAQALEVGRTRLLIAGFEKVDYLALVNGDDLTPILTPSLGGRLLAAVKLERVRLIDNLPVAPQKAD